ncbi:PREDICTED: uncharacterized protein LOC106750304 [Dinoponera quadriceps]|uniref:Uncharacterized protein LOC106750304 n=1 Tax=Dinoponera quadriceps TaxID=609295 RepID=A0A6P3Y596_DINQU|nr:PREDICTED: uncharacterized protein LOC106750304 [Dinoponera quadriceps]XP_014486044.1 PREDICTED: uncharacterized protein LOC106750304 [Dinoponera quadriceps]XP_014486045.1 PREDICTED: uncharacterized protein LOC106750304 [Dinoponera quadriceps]
MVTSTASALPSNVTRHFVRTMNGGYLSNPESSYVSHHQQTIRDYLNQTMPLPAQRHLRARDRAIYQATGGRNNLVDRSCTVAADVGTTGDHRRAARGQGGRLQERRSVDAGCIGQRKLSSTCDGLKFLDSSSQRHGVIAASVYKELCNGSIGVVSARVAGAFLGGEERRLERDGRGSLCSRTRSRGSRAWGVQARVCGDFFFFSFADEDLYTCATKRPGGFFSHLYATGG